MDVYMHLSSDLKAEDVCLTTIKLLDHIALNLHTDLSYANIEQSIKAALFVDVVGKLLGEQLPQSLQEYNALYAHIFRSNKLFDDHAIGFVVTKILQANNGMEALHIVDSILKHVRSAHVVGDDFFHGITEKVLIGSELNSKREEHLLLIVQRIFKLPTEHIEGAVDRLLSNLHFNILGWLFLMPDSSPHVDKCAVLEHKICTRLTNGNVPPYHIRSMLDTIQTARGLRFFWKCLQNESFSQSLRAFFLQHIIKTDDTQSEGNNCILYLIGAALKDDSPCQRDLFKQLYSLESKYWLRSSLANTIFVFD